MVFLNRLWQQKIIPFNMNFFLLSNSQNFPPERLFTFCFYYFCFFFENCAQTYCVMVNLSYFYKIYTKYLRCTNWYFKVNDAGETHSNKSTLHRLENLIYFSAIIVVCVRVGIYLCVRRMAVSFWNNMYLVFAFESFINVGKWFIMSPW